MNATKTPSTTSLRASGTCARARCPSRHDPCSAPGRRVDGVRSRGRGLAPRALAAGRRARAVSGGAARGAADRAARRDHAVSAGALRRGRLSGRRLQGRRAWRTSRPKRRWPKFAAMCCRRFLPDTRFFKTTAFGPPNMEYSTGRNAGRRSGACREETTSAPPFPSPMAEQSRKFMAQFTGVSASTVVARRELALALAAGCWRRRWPGAARACPPIGVLEARAEIWQARGALARYRRDDGLERSSRSHRHLESACPRRRHRRLHLLRPRLTVASRLTGPFRNGRAPAR